MYRQGDLLIVRVLGKTVTPNDTYRVVESGIVQEGEATGHAHRLVGGQVLESRERWDPVIYLVSDGDTKLVHDEHDTIELPEGPYRVLRQRQYESDGSWSNVVD